MPAKYLLDSDVCILAVRKGNASLTRLVSAIRPDGLAISVITYGEVREGVLYSRDPARNAAVWADFVAGVDVVDVTMTIADVWAEVRGALRERGRPVSDNDLLIAATALRFGMTVVSGNLRHFGHIPGLNVLLAER